ncbi:MAG: OB-fold nucleic acid binding domain-containing protein, partial [Thermoguttaceae bacterium]
AFTAALLNSQPMGFYAPPQLVRNARDHGVDVRPIDVNHSDWDCTLEGGPAISLRLGFNMLHGLASAHARQIEHARDGRPFRSMDDFARRTGLSRSVLSRLAGADVFGSLELNRREALWHALDQDQEELPLFDQCSKPHATDAKVDLPRLSEAEEVLADYRTAGLSLKAHPLEFLRAELDAMEVVAAEALKDWPIDRPIRVAGIVLVRQRPGTAKGITFVTLEDETGTANLIIRPGVWRRYRRAAMGATLLLAHGRLQRQGQIIHVLVTKLENLSDRLQGMGRQSRDFC